MRICLVAHGFPPEERTGVETYTASLAGSLVRAGHGVEVFTACPNPRLADLAHRRSEVAVDCEAGDLGYGVSRIATNGQPSGPGDTLDPPGLAEVFAAFLERERPEIVHFQHVIKLGLGLITAAKEAGIPVLYTHHDYYGACHRYTFLRPDLKVCKRPNDSEACARCDVALGLLNGIPGLGDYQMGVDPEMLDEGPRAKLAGLLDGDPVRDGGLDKQEWASAQELRKTLDVRRSKVFGELDLRISPSRFLAGQMQDSGMGEVEHLPNGIETEDLLPVAQRSPVREPAPGQPLRILYIGSLVKQKGVDVLIEAFGKLNAAPNASQRPRVQLTLRGYASDQVWVEELKRRATEVGALWKGGYQRQELPEILEVSDVVVVPSTWFENYPIAIREAFAAGRPVVTSRLGALEESVEDGVDGLLFEAGDSDDLAAALGRLLDEPGLVTKLAAGIGPVQTMEDQARDLAIRYQSLVDAVPVEDFGAAPIHMQPFLQRCRELELRPARQLFGDVLTGLSKLSSRLGLKSQDLQVSDILRRSFSSGDKAQRQLRDYRRESSWLRESLDGVQGASASQVQRIGWLEDSVKGQQESIGALEMERDDAVRARADFSEKADWLKLSVAQGESALASKDTELEWLKKTVAEKDQAIASMGEEVEWLRGVTKGHEQGIAAQELELGSLKDRYLELENKLVELQSGHAEAEQSRAALEQRLHERLHQVAETGLLALRGQEHAMVQGLEPLFEALDRASGLSSDRSLEAIEYGVEHLVSAVEAGLMSLGTLQDDLLFRTTEMEGLSRDAESFMLKLLLARTSIRRRLDRWRETGATHKQEQGDE